MEEREEKAREEEMKAPQPEWFRGIWGFKTVCSAQAGNSYFLTKILIEPTNAHTWKMTAELVSKKNKEQFV